MILAGDVAIAPEAVHRFEEFPVEVREAPWCLNLEGAIGSPGAFPKWGVCNSSDWSRSFAAFRLGPVFLANNHIHDLPQGVARTYDALGRLGLCGFAAGANENSARKFATVSSGRHTYLLLGFGWPVIGCRPAGLVRMGVNVLEGRSVRRQVAEALVLAPKARVVVVVHGNYEFERYPQPAHRKLAMELVDMGAYAVIGHHPHVVGPVERYKGRTIAYSLGNWAFSYGRFFGGRLRFPDSSFQQIAIELGDEGDTVHHARFTPPTLVRYQFSEPVNGTNFSLRPDFQGFSHDAYVSWFKVNRVKRKGLPMYVDPDDSIGNWLRDRWVGTRQMLIDAASKAGLKAMRRAE